MEFTPDQIHEAAKNITHSEVIAFLNEKVKQHNCPTCFSNDWTFVGSPEHTLGLLALPKNGNFPLPPLNVGVIPLACKVCGYMRIHAAGLMGLWKLENSVRQS